MVKDFKYILKRILIGTGIAIALMCIKGGLIADTYAMSIDFYNGNTKCATCNSGYNCSYSGGGTCATINRISIHEPSYTLQNGSTYDLYSTIVLGVNRNNYCTTSNLGLRSDFYIGNYQGTSWVQGNTTWNNVDDISPGTNNYCNYTWGSVQRFVPGFSSSGITYDFYFSNASYINFVNVKRFELVNQGTSDKDAINNASNQIINNNNQNTQNIINSNNQINDSITDDTAPSDSDIDDLFDFNTWPSSTPVSDLITMPITLVQAYINGFNSSCSSINLGTLLGTQLILPCINVEYYLGSNLWNVIDLMFSMFLVYNVGLMCISMYDSLTSLRDNFPTLYTPRHGAHNDEYVPKHGGDN